MEKTEYDSEYNKDGMFLLSRSNNWGTTHCLALRHDYREALDRYFVELGLYHTHRGETEDVCFPLTENDIDQLILKLQTMKEELIKKNTK